MGRKLTCVKKSKRAKAYRRRAPKKCKIKKKVIK